VVGCKWSAAVLAAIGRGVSRPGQLERFIPGISTKILTERLRKLVDYRLITRTEIAGKVPRTEYALTATGVKLNAIIESIRDLDEEHDAGTES
jgi:DNA-binding HxlR family transcriptional regulator